MGFTSLKDEEPLQNMKLQDKQAGKKGKQCSSEVLT